MKLTQLSIQKDRITTVAVVLMIFMGVQAYWGAPRDEDPGFLIRVAVVATEFPGASPARVERLVTDRVETAVRQIPELKVVTSESRQGLSIVFVELRPQYFELQPIWDDLRRKVEAVRSELPDGVIGPFVDDEFADVYGILISITGPGFTNRDMYEVAKDVRDELLFLPDAAKVVIRGEQKERIFLDYSNARLARFGLSPTQLANALAARNIVSAGGSVVTEFERIALEPTGNFESFSELQEMSIGLPRTGELVPLRDLVDVSRGVVDPPATIRRLNGASALGVAVSMREGGNLIELGGQVRALLERMQQSLPLGLELSLSQFQPGIVERKIDDFEMNLVQAVLIVAGIMLLALGLRTGLIVASLVPVAIISSFVVMGAMGIGLDQMSLAALIISLGLLVDNAIVVSESIVVEAESGKTISEAAVSSAKELASPLLISSLTTAAAFLPIYLAESSSGEYTAPIFKVVTITLICSWIASLTVIPMLCVRFLRVDSTARAIGFESSFYRRYRGALSLGLRHPWLAVASAIGLLALAIFSFRFVPNIFFPENDRPLIVGELEFPFGAAIEHTIAATQRIDDYIGEELRAGGERAEGVTDWVTYAGEGGPRFTLGYTPAQPAPHVATLLINATSRDAVIDLAPRLEAWCNENFPGLKATIRPLQTGPASWPPVQVQIMGSDTALTFQIVEELMAKMRSIPGTKLIDHDWGAQAKKLVVRIDQDRARRAGLTSQDIAISLETYLGGLEATEFREGEELIPITLRASGHGRSDLGELESINVSSQSLGTVVPLKQVADIDVVWEPGIVRRRDRLRTVTVEAATTTGTTAAEVNAALEPWLEQASLDWPFGFRWRFAGEHENSAEANASIAAKLPLAGLAITLLLVLQFNSIRKAAIVLLTIPFGIVGVVAGLLIAQSYFGFMTLLGIVSLSGIVINNAIVLLDRIQLEIDEFGRTPGEAIMEASQRRLRPILLTTATTVGGLLPLWIGGGPMFEPMAIAILFGLVFATVLTLGLVPVLYSILFRVRVGRGEAE